MTGLLTTLALQMANNYAMNKQWGNAAAVSRVALKRQYCALLESAEALDRIDGLWEALYRVYAKAMKEGPISEFRITEECQSAEDDPTLQGEHGSTTQSVLCELRKRLAERFFAGDHCMTDKLSCANHITVVPSTSDSLPAWTIVYHSIEQFAHSVKDKWESGTFYISRKEPTFAFILKLPARDQRAFECHLNLPVCEPPKRPVGKQEKMEVAEIGDTRRKRLSYAWAHLAENASLATKTLYQVSTVVVTSDLVAMFQRAYGFQVALAIRPDYDWAHAHLGEFYRNIANGWGQGAKSRLEHYVRAVDYLFYSLESFSDPSTEELVEQGSRLAWPLAHLGAAIVNVRAFAGVSSLEQDGFDVLEPLAGEWREAFSGQFPELELEEGRDGESQYNSVKLMELARDYLVDGQGVRGFFYPWAQNYHACALLILTMTSERYQDLSLAQLSTSQMLHSFVLQPELAANLFEPGQLFRNPNLEFGAMFTSTGNYPVAWQCAWIGMQYLFKFDFVSGVQGLLGSMIMVLSSAGEIQPLSSTKRKPVQHCELLEMSGFLRRKTLLEKLCGSLKIPPAIIVDSEKLIRFIQDLFEVLAKPTIKPQLLPGVVWTTAISVGMTAAQHILYTYVLALLYMGVDHDDVSVAQIWEYVLKIDDKLGNSGSFIPPDVLTQDSERISALLLAEVGGLNGLIFFGQGSYNLKYMLTKSVA